MSDHRPPAHSTPAPTAAPPGDVQRQLLGMVGILLGVLLLSCLPATLVGLFMDMRWVNPELTRVPLSTGETLFRLIHGLAGIGLGVLALLGGIGCLARWRSARKLLMAYAVGAIVVVLAGLAAWWLSLDASLAREQSVATERIDLAALRSRQIFVAVSGTIFLVTLHAILLLLLTRRHIRAALGAGSVSR